MAYALPVGKCRANKLDRQYMTTDLSQDWFDILQDSVDVGSSQYCFGLRDAGYMEIATACKELLAEGIYRK